jgi:hypothetical protein
LEFYFWRFYFEFLYVFFCCYEEYISIAHNENWLYGTLFLYELHFPYFGAAKVGCKHCPGNINCITFKCISLYNHKLNEIQHVYIEDTLNLLIFFHCNIRQIIFLICLKTTSLLPICLHGMVLNYIIMCIFHTFCTKCRQRLKVGNSGPNHLTTSVVCSVVKFPKFRCYKEVISDHYAIQVLAYSSYVRSATQPSCNFSTKEPLPKVLLSVKWKTYLVLYLCLTFLV